MELRIRSEESRDTDHIRAVVRAAFPSEAESKLVDALRTHGKSVISLVAVTGNEVSGHILFSPVSTAPPPEAKGMGLAPVAVRPDSQSQGIGSQLIREGLRLGKERGFDYCVYSVIRATINVLVLKRQACSVYETNTGLMMSLW
jgi:putative acetyltransferase